MHSFNVCQLTMQIDEPTTSCQSVKKAVIESISNFCGSSGRPAPPTIVPSCEADQVRPLISESSLLQKAISRVEFGCFKILLLDYTLELLPLSERKDLSPSS